jgi:predicted ribosome quality control (RQC) complex YloA/Tae2 family protein
MVNFREHVASSGLRVLGGKNAESNDELVSRAGRNDVMLHTAIPGSPFVNVGVSPSKEDLKEAAVFCAKFSQDWRDSKRDVVVNKFLRGDMSKDIGMKAGSWSVKKQDKVKVKAVDILKFEKVLRAEGALGNREDLD